jgi:DNA-binding IclR family transcriptional regulator
MIRPMAGPSADTHCAVLTNHGLVLLTIARNPNVRVRDIADAVGITERATQAILRDLDRGGYIERSRVGRRNRYGVRRRAALPHALLGSATVGDLVDALTPGPRTAHRLVL